MSKGKTFVFVDTENVGHSIPLKIPKTIKAFFYIKDKNILPKVYPNCMHKQIGRASCRERVSWYV